MLRKVIFILTFFSPGVLPIGQPFFLLPALFELYRAQRHGPPPFSMGHMNRGHGHHMGHGGRGNQCKGNHGHHGNHGPPPFAQGHGHHEPPPFDYGPPDYEVPVHRPKSPTKQATTVPPVTTKPTTKTTSKSPPRTVVATTTPNYGAGAIDVRFAKPKDRRKRSPKPIDTALTIDFQTLFNSVNDFPLWNTTVRKSESHNATYHQVFVHFIATNVARVTTKPTTTTTSTPTPTTSTTPNYGAGKINVRFGKPKDRRKRSTKTVDPAVTTEIHTRYNSLPHYALWNTPDPKSEPLPGYTAPLCAQKNYECVPAHACKTAPGRTGNNRRFCDWAHDQPFVCCAKEKNKKFQRREIRCGRSRTSTRLSQAIIGGAAVSGAASYPWMTAIGEVLANGEVDWYCGGALVGEKTVVTAAHCISRRTADVIRIGETNLKLPKGDTSSNLQQISVRGVLRHPLYRPPALYNDLALLYLEEPVRLTPFSRPICLSQFTSVSHTPVALLTGWGQLSFASERSAQLQEVSIQVVNNTYCDKQYSVTQASTRYFPKGILDSLLCAGDDSGGKDACQGDSGAPLVAEEDGDLVLIGIVSAGIGCGSKTFPGVYTRVSAFTPWIHENIE